MRIALVALTIASLSGCALERTPLSGPGMDAGDDPDVPTGIDAGTVDDGGTEPLDAGTDAPVECAPSPARCEGETLITCVDGRFVRDDCAGRGAYCDGATCVPQVCVPGSVTCAGTTASRCDARGSGAVSTDCPRGCTAGSGCDAPPACPLMVAGELTGAGSLRVSTCGQGDDSSASAGCTRSALSGADVVVRLQIVEGGPHRIEGRLSGSSDPVVYLRRACDDPSSTFACDDDSAPGVSSRIDTDLPAGDYFVIVDSFRDAAEGVEGRCGDVDLVVARR